jgi:hypothetical protein
VVVASRSDKHVAEAVSALGGEPHFGLIVDVADPKSIEEGFKQVHRVPFQFKLQQGFEVHNRRLQCS